MAEKGKTIRLEVITPDAAVLNEDVEFVLVRALDGDLGIMPNHAPLIASFVITPAAEKPEDIDVERAEAAQQRAEALLHSQRKDIDVHRAEMALKRALCRLDTAKKYGGH